MLANEIRQAYIDYFTKRGHLLLPSAPLVPIDHLGNPDDSTLFTGSGMQQFKPYFTGSAKPPSARATTVQKCVRTGDIDSVGDYSHCTFFEMLGNFSFGDYFKAEVIPWTWDFLTNVAGLDGDRFCVTVYRDDDEAFQIWHDAVGLSEDRIHRMGQDKNFWLPNAITDGPNGPCGPCSEVFYRVAPLSEMTADSSLTPTERYKIDDDAGRWLEVWNNVFTQYDRQEDEHGKGILIPLPKKNNDTGAGLDRIVMAQQDKRSVFETDLFRPILARIEDLAKRRYGGTMEPADFAFRCIAEHARTMVFCIGDGILPGNEGRDYVLRYIVRRAVRYSKTALGFDKPFLHEVAPLVIEQMGGHYSELRERQELILKTIHNEEESFRRTLDNGMRRLEELFESTAVKQANVLPGRDAFKLHDTYGFPLKLTEDLSAERGITVDLEGFGEAMEEQRKRSRAGGMGTTVFATEAGGALMFHTDATQFLGYASTDAESRILKLFQKGTGRSSAIRTEVNTAGPGSEVEVVLDMTPFYAESGGQVGDAGWVFGPGGDVTCATRIEVLDTRKFGGVYLHIARVLEGEAFPGQRVLAQVNAARRRHIVRNHTATHLLQAALREVLGSHVHQKGSLVAPDRLRFDFTSEPVSPTDLRKVEEIVNERILDDIPVVVHTDVPVDEAKKRGAMALFGEKYGDRVRMIEIPEFSLELCGGTHLQHTSQAGLFKILSESGVAAGIRRIEAVTGQGAYDFMSEKENTLSQLAQVLKTSPKDVLMAAEKLQQQRAQLEKQIQQLRSGAAGKGADLKEQAVDGVRIVTGAVPNADAETLAALADRTANQHKSAVIVLASAADGKALFIAKVTSDLIKQGYHAGNLVREVAKIAGGGGGGRPDFAQAGGRDPSKVDEALLQVPAIVSSQKLG